MPPAEVKRLLELKPDGVIGISVPGMPLESPGMQQGSEPEKYDVILFKKDGTQEIFATYIGDKNCNDRSLAGEILNFVRLEVTKKRLFNHKT